MIEIVPDGTGDFEVYNPASGQQIGHIVKLPNGQWRCQRWDKRTPHEDFVNIEAARLWFLEVNILLPVHMRRKEGGE